MNYSNILLIGLASFSCGFINPGCQAQTSDLPNIVLIMADDMGYECVGANGNTEYQTPNLDRLATNGIRFEHCYSQPLCTPSRVKIMTGKFNFRNYENFEYLNPNQKTFANLLKDAGYATCIAGKWQLNGIHYNYPGNQDLNRPKHFGFDEYSLWQLNHSKSEGERYSNPLITQNGEDLPRDKDAYGPQIFADFISDFINRKAGQPFFIYYPMVLVHTPFVPTPDSPEWADPSRRYENDVTYFADMMAYTDKIVGQIEAKLREKGVWENTLFIFTTDNGTANGVISNTEKGKIVGAKGKTINTGNHVPMVITWPKMNNRGRVFEGAVDFADVLPTLADVAGIEPSTYVTDGKSFLNILKGDNRRIGKDEIFIHYSPRWLSMRRLHNRWVMDGEYKLYKDGRFYNTVNDPDEKNVITSKLSKNEEIIMKKFQAILKEKEHDFPFEWNDIYLLHQVPD